MDTSHAWCFAYNGDELLVLVSEAPVRRGTELVPRGRDLAAAGLLDGELHFLGTLENAPVLALRVDGAEAPRGMRFEPLRPLFAALGEELFRVAGTAKQIVTWDRDHRFCGRCGAPTRTKPDERAKMCTACGHLAFPRLAPAIIVAVTRDDRLLMAHASRFPPGLYSVIAGFVEPGESLEECVRREVREETGIEVEDIRYFGSQSWPFPHSLMLAFTARYASGEISVDGKELEEAGWFSADAMPQVPDRASISRRLIDWFVERRGSCCGAAKGA